MGRASVIELVYAADPKVAEELRGLLDSNRLVAILLKSNSEVCEEYVKIIGRANKEIVDPLSMLLASCRHGIGPLQGS